jgi:hypothetical protein
VTAAPVGLPLLVDPAIGLTSDVLADVHAWAATLPADTRPRENRPSL